MFTFLVDGKLHPLAIVPHGGHSGVGVPKRYSTGKQQQHCRQKLYLVPFICDLLLEEYVNPKFITGILGSTALKQKSTFQQKNWKKILAATVFSHISAVDIQQHLEHWTGENYTLSRQTSRLFINYLSKIHTTGHAFTAISKLPGGAT